MLQWEPISIVQNPRTANMKAAYAGNTKSVDIQSACARSITIQSTQMNADQVSRHFEFINAFVAIDRISYAMLLFLMTISITK